MANKFDWLYKTQDSVWPAVDEVMGGIPEEFQLEGWRMLRYLLKCRKDVEVFVAALAHRLENWDYREEEMPFRGYPDMRTNVLRAGARRYFDDLKDADKEATFKLADIMSACFRAAAVDREPLNKLRAIVREN